jgi:AcrR family transcriptional regulator
VKVRTEARRNAILEAAAKLFQEMGYERASMNELARRFGGSKATLYGYFSSKEELFVAVVEAFATAHLLDAVEKLWVEAQGQSTLEALLMKFGERMLCVLTNDENALAVYRMVVAEAGHSNVGQLFYESGPAEAGKAIEGLLETAMDRGELRRSDPRVAALHFLALVTAECDSRLYQRDPPPLALKQIRSMVRRAVDIFLRGIAER